MLGHREMFSFQQTTTSLRQIVDAVIPPADTDALEEKQKHGWVSAKPHRAERVRGSIRWSRSTAPAGRGDRPTLLLVRQTRFLSVARGSAARPLSEGQPPTQEWVTLTVRGRRTLTRAIASSNDAERRFLARLSEDEAIRFRRGPSALVHAPG
jgi:hypothetical protein